MCYCLSRDTHSKYLIERSEVLKNNLPFWKSWDRQVFHLCQSVCKCVHLTYPCRCFVILLTYTLKPVNTKPILKRKEKSLCKWVWCPCVNHTSSEVPVWIKHPLKSHLNHTSCEVPVWIRHPLKSLSTSDILWSPCLNHTSPEVSVWIRHPLKSLCKSHILEVPV